MKWTFWRETRHLSGCRECSGEGVNLLVFLNGSSVDSSQDVIPNVKNN
ncbi:hypothetical protein [Atrimonas thermophila]